MMCFLSLLAVGRCLTISDSTTASVTATTEAPVELLIMEQEDKLDEADVPSDSSKEKDQQAEEQDSAKNKRTLEGFLGYGYNRVSGSESGTRFNRQLAEHGKLRAYFTQPPPQHAYRYYSGQLVHGGVPQEEYTPRAQVEAQQHRPYATIPLPNTNSADLGVPPEYFTKAVYQQQLSYHPGTGTVLTPSSPQAAFAPASHPGGAFYTLPALASSQIFPAANPFLALGHNFLLPHSGSSGLALLQNPSSPYGAQIIPVIILRVAPGVDHSAIQHQQQSYLQSPSGLNLLYQQSQRQQENPQQSSNQNQHVIYQDNPKVHYIHAPQKTVYKKPVGPTQAPSTATHKPRKNIIVVNEQPEARSEASYSQYKYATYKDKA